MEPTRSGRDQISATGTFVRLDRNRVFQRGEPCGQIFRPVFCLDSAAFLCLFCVFPVSFRVFFCVFSASFRVLLRHFSYPEWLSPYRTCVSIIQPISHL